MKQIWTILFVAIAIAVVGIALLVVPKESQTEKFWISLGGIGLGLVAMFVAFTYAPAPQGEQAGAMMKGMMYFSSVMYFVGTLLLALVAISPISGRWLGVLHIVALLLWVVLACFGALGAKTLESADNQGQQ